jgi:hypothetical protein
MRFSRFYQVQFGLLNETVVIVPQALASFRPKTAGVDHVSCASLSPAWCASALATEKTKQLQRVSPGRMASSAGGY